MAYIAGLVLHVWRMVTENPASDTWFRNIVCGWHPAGIRRNVLNIASGGRLTPDFKKAQCFKIFRLRPDFKMLHLPGIWQASGCRQTQCMEITCQVQCFKIRRQTQHFKIFRQTQFSVTIRQMCIRSGILYAADITLPCWVGYRFLRHGYYQTYPTIPRDLCDFLIEIHKFSMSHAWWNTIVI